VKKGSRKIKYLKNRFTGRSEKEDKLKGREKNIRPRGERGPRPWKKLSGQVGGPPGEKTYEARETRRRLGMKARKTADRRPGSKKKGDRPRTEHPHGAGGERGFAQRGKTLNPIGIKCKGKESETIKKREKSRKQKRYGTPKKLKTSGVEK